MKFMRLFSFFLFTLTCFTTYANENKYIFVGQNGDGGSLKMAFILELLGDDIENHAQINENGEVYIKVDKIVSIPKGTFSRFACPANPGYAVEVPYSAETIGSAYLTSTSVQSPGEEKLIRCSNPRCRWSYYVRPGYVTSCPQCGTVNYPW